MTPSPTTVDRPRVLVVTHLFPTAAKQLQGPWVAEQVDALAAYADISVFCASQWADNGSVTRDSGVRVHFVRTATPLGQGRAGLLASSVRYERALSAFVADHRGEFDVLHAHFGFPDAVVVSRVARRFGLPFVVTLHGDDAFRLLPRRDVLGSAIRRAVDGAATTICVSEAMRKAVVAAAPGANAVVAENGYDATLFNLAEPVEREPLLFVGLLVAVKNVDLLLRAYASLAADTRPPLVIAGDGPLRGALERLAAELDICSDVLFLGEQDRRQVATLMRSARALLLPSASEGWGMVVAEALACGTPVVASRVGGVPEIMGSKDAGILISPGDHGALKAGLLAVMGRSWEPALVAAASNARPWSEQVQGVYRCYEAAVAALRGAQSRA